VTVARFAAFHALPFALLPFEDALFRSADPRVKSGHLLDAASAAGFRLWPGGGRCAPTPLLHLFACVQLSSLANRGAKPESELTVDQVSSCAGVFILVRHKSCPDFATMTK
jgi:hypothetical protein